MGSVIFFEEPLKWLAVITIVGCTWFLLLMYGQWLYRIFTRPKENRNARDRAASSETTRRPGDPEDLD